MVLVSCVTKDRPYKSHPHCLTGDDCKMGIFQKRVLLDSNTIISFSFNLLSTLVRDMDSVLKQRKDQRIDPFSSELLLIFTKLNIFLKKVTSVAVELITM